MSEGGGLNEWGWFLVVVPMLVVLLVLVIAVWQWRARVERLERIERHAQQRRRWAVSERRLSKLHVIQSDPGHVQRVHHPKENHE